MSIITIKKVTCSLILGTALCMMLQAEDPKEAKRRQMGAAMMAGAKLLKSLDQNGDGELSRAEIEMASATLKDMDTDGDGKVSSEELGIGSNPLAQSYGSSDGAAESPSKPQKMMGKPKISDRNGDGKVTAEDLPERARARFAMMDTNKDGELDADEIAVVEKKIKDMMSRGGGRAAGKEREGGKKSLDPLGGPVEPKRPE